MSQKQLERFMEKALENKKLKGQIEACGTNNVCVAAVGQRYGHKFSPANVGRWQRDHGGAMLS